MYSRCIRSDDDYLLLIAAYPRRWNRLDATYQWATANERHFNKSMSLIGTKHDPPWEKKLTDIMTAYWWSLGTPFGAVFNSSSLPNIFCRSPLGWGFATPKNCSNSEKEMISRSRPESRLILDLSTIIELNRIKLHHMMTTRNRMRMGDRVSG